MYGFVNNGNEAELRHQCTECGVTLSNGALKTFKKQHLNEISNAPGKAGGIFQGKIKISNISKYNEKQEQCYQCLA